MVHKITVGLQQKVGQPNFGSLGANCSVEIQLNDGEIADPGLFTSRIQQAFATCRQSISAELAANHPSSQTVHRQPVPDHQPAVVQQPRQATEAQVRAIRVIASKAGVQLASELESRFGVRTPSQLSLSQASQLIDELKSQSAPA